MLLAIFESGRALRALLLSAVRSRDLRAEPLRALRCGLFTWDKNVHGEIEVICLRNRINVVTGAKRFSLVVGCTHHKVFVHDDGTYDVLKDWDNNHVLYCQPKEPTKAEIQEALRVSSRHTRLEKPLDPTEKKGIAAAAGEKVACFPPGEDKDITPPVDQ